jgi:hypothetical protein
MRLSSARLPIRRLTVMSGLAEVLNFIGAEDLERPRRRSRCEPMYRDGSTDFLSLGGVLPQFAPGVDLGEELLDRDGCVCRAGRAEDVERVLSAGQFAVDDGLGARFA